MEAETIHFLECVAKGRQPLVTAEHARMVMQVYQAADISAEESRPVDILPDGLPADWQAGTSDPATAGRAPVIS